MDSSVTAFRTKKSTVRPEDVAGWQVSRLHHITWVSIELERKHINDDAVALLGAFAIRCKSLRILNLSRNSIGDDGAASLAEAIPLIGGGQLLHLDLSHNNVSAKGASAVSHQFFPAKADIVKQNHAVEVEKTSDRILDFSYNNLGDEGVGAIATSVAQSSGTAGLRLRNVSCTVRGAKALVRCRQYLSEINLGMNKIGTAGVVLLCQALQDAPHCKALLVEDLRKTDALSFQQPEAAKSAILQALSYAPQLRQLYFGGNGIGDVACAEVVDKLVLGDSMHGLEDLSLPENNCGLETSRSLRRLLLSASTASGIGGLRSLDLSYSCLDDRCASLLADGVAQNATLSQLNLAGNQITCSGIQRLSLGIKCQLEAEMPIPRGQPGCLVELDLRFNPIRDQGAEAIAVASLSSDFARAKQFIVPWGIERVLLEGANVGSRGQSFLELAVATRAALALTAADVLAFTQNDTLLRRLRVDGVRMPTGLRVVGLQLDDKVAADMLVDARARMEEMWPEPSDELPAHDGRLDRRAPVLRAKHVDSGTAPVAGDSLMFSSSVAHILEEMSVSSGQSPEIIPFTETSLTKFEDVADESMGRKECAEFMTMAETNLTQFDDLRQVEEPSAAGDALMLFGGISLGTAEDVDNHGSSWMAGAAGQNENGTNPDTFDWYEQDDNPVKNMILPVAQKVNGLPTWVNEQKPAAAGYSLTVDQHMGPDVDRASRHVTFCELGEERSACNAKLNSILRQRGAGGISSDECRTGKPLPDRSLDERQILSEIGNISCDKDVATSGSISKGGRSSNSETGFEMIPGACNGHGHACPSNDGVRIGLEGNESRGADTYSNFDGRSKGKGIGKGVGKGLGKGFRLDRLAAGVLKVPKAVFRPNSVGTENIESQYSATSAQEIIKKVGTGLSDDKTEVVEVSSGKSPLNKTNHANSAKETVPPPSAKGGKRGGKSVPPPPQVQKGKSTKGKGKGVSGDSKTRMSRFGVAPLGKRMILCGTSYENVSAESVWGQLSMTDAVVNTDLLKALFSPEAEEKQQQMSRKRQLISKRLGICLLDSARAQNMAIVLNRMPLRTIELRALLETYDFNDDRLRVDDLELLSSILPTTEERELLLKNRDKAFELRDVEQHVLPLCLIPRCETRLKLMRFALSHNSMFTSLTERCSTLVKASHEARHSSQLRYLFELILKAGNFINHGVDMTPESFVLKGFAVESLGNLSTFKTGTCSTLHFLALTARSSDSNFLQELRGSLKHVGEASRENIPMLKAQLDSFKSEVTIIEEEMSRLRTQVEQLSASESSLHRLQAIKDALEQEMKELLKRFDEAMEAVALVQRYFAAKENCKAKAQGAEELLAHISSFIRLFESTWREIEKKPSKWQNLAGSALSAPFTLREVEPPRRSPRDVQPVDRRRGSKRSTCNAVAI
eukprot:TRINITY_DN15844_c1_g2_i1.p1 TRINITY_DN15844_c1_g2~~TRINITY_DN15844_c1_g2_i1.p1  ORF type:complete len:1418 (-),score=190.05 TRINITY_DN15844_c1_g2_i1:341-4594(-)